MAPIKALCSERCSDWSEKFERFGLKCRELTGDSELDDYYQLQQVNIIFTTPVNINILIIHFEIVEYTINYADYFYMFLFFVRKSGTA